MNEANPRVIGQFDIETAVSRQDDVLWRGHVSSAWNIGTNPNGGYLLSLVTSALADALPHPDPISITTHYLRPGIADAPCDIRVEIVRTGRTLSTARATLLQDGNERLVALAAYGNLEQPAGIDREISPPAPSVPGPELCQARSGGAQGVGLAIAERVDARLLPDFIEPGHAGRAEVAGWIRLSDGREPDARALHLFSDAFPPSPFGLLGPVGWVPTVELTVHVRRRPVPGWVQARFVTDDLQMGRMIESGWLWDSAGNLVAQSRQIGLVMDQG